MKNVVNAFGLRKLCVSCMIILLTTSTLFINVGSSQEKEVVTAGYEPFASERATARRDRTGVNDSEIKTIDWENAEVDTVAWQDAEVDTVAWNGQEAVAHSEYTLLDDPCDACGEVSCGCDPIVGCDSMGCGSGSGCSLGLGRFFGRGGRSSGCIDWLQAEYLMWWSSGMQTPTLLARATEQNPEVGTALFGGPAGDLLEGMRSGMRLRGGHWLDACQTYGVEFEYLFLGTIDDSYSIGDNGALGSTVYTRPFFNALTNQPDAELISFPGEIRGTGRVHAEGDFHSAGVRLVWNQCRQCCEQCGPCGPIRNQSRFDVLAGYRYASLEESLLIREDLRTLSPPAGLIFDIRDRFATSNQFHGGEVGMRWQEQYAKYSLEFLGKLAFGSNRQRVRISGRTLATNGNVTSDEVGGLLAQTTNIGTYSRNRFALIPEIGATLGYSFRPNWRATLGYSIIYWDRVVRPGDQIDTALNPNLLPPAINVAGEPMRPEFRWQENGFWTQGISFGLAYTR